MVLGPGTTAMDMLRFGSALGASNRPSDHGPSDSAPQSAAACCAASHYTFNGSVWSAAECEPSIRVLLNSFS